MYACCWGGYAGCGYGLYDGCGAGAATDLGAKPLKDEEPPRGPALKAGLKAGVEDGGGRAGRDGWGEDVLGGRPGGGG